MQSATISLFTKYQSYHYTLLLKSKLVNKHFFIGLGLSCYHIGAAYAVQVYFTSKRSLAQGIVMAGQSLGSFTWAPLSMWLFSQYGWRGALMIIGGIQLHGVVLAILLYNIKLAEEQPTKEIPEHGREKTTPPFHFTGIKGVMSVFWNPILIFFYMSHIFNQFGHHLPYLWLPTLSYQAGVSEDAAAIAVSAFSKHAHEYANHLH